MMQQQASPVFIVAVRKAVEAATQSSDDCVRYAAAHVPIYAQKGPTPEQARAGGCSECTYLGLWAYRWPGFEVAPHGIIWLFEDGITAVAIQTNTSLVSQCLNVILHEIEHALQRDHILQAVESTRSRVAGNVVRLDGYRP